MRDPRAVAVTGASGTLGRAIARHLLACGLVVRALARRPDTVAIEGVETRHHELAETLAPEALSGCRAIVHCAAATRGEESADERGAHELLRAARAAGVERVVFLSSLSAAGQARSSYARAKRAIEAMLDPERDVCLRLGLVLTRGREGLFGRMTAWVERSPVLAFFGDGRQPVQAVHVDDLCRAVELALLGAPAGTFHVAAPSPLAYRELLRSIAQRLGRRRLLLPVPFGPAIAGIRALRALGVPTPVTPDNLQGLRSQRFVPTAADLERLGVRLRDVQEALDDVLGDG